MIVVVSGSAFVCHVFSFLRPVVVLVVVVVSRYKVSFSESQRNEMLQVECASLQKLYF